jgi:hypothetical protein
VEGNVHGLFQGAILALAWRKWGKPQKVSVRTVTVPAEVRTRHLPNTRQKCSSLIQFARWHWTLKSSGHETSIHRSAHGPVEWMPGRQWYVKLHCYYNLTPMCRVLEWMMSFTWWRNSLLLWNMKSHNHGHKIRECHSPSEEIPSFYGTYKFTTVFTTKRSYSSLPESRLHLHNLFL